MVASTASAAWSATPPAATATRWATGWAASVTRSITGSAFGTLGAGLRTASIPPVMKIEDRRGRAMRRTIMASRFPVGPRLTLPRDPRHRPRSRHAEAGDRRRSARRRSAGRANTKTRSSSSPPARKSMVWSAVRRLAVDDQLGAHLDVGGGGVAVVASPRPRRGAGRRPSGSALEPTRPAPPRPAAPRDLDGDQPDQRRAGSTSATAKVTHSAAVRGLAAASHRQPSGGAADGGRQAEHHHAGEQVAHRLDAALEQPQQERRPPAGRPGSRRSSR